MIFLNNEKKILLRDITFLKIVFSSSKLLTKIIYLKNKNLKNIKT